MEKVYFRKSRDKFLKDFSEDEVAFVFFAAEGFTGLPRGCPDLRSASEQVGE